jgi:hypothetical protein
VCLIFLDIRHRGYARRYALFTLVGIAGEDNLDAPDLVAPTPQTKSSGPERARRSMAPNGRLNADQRRVEHRTPIERPQKTSPVHDAVMPDTQLSARLRDQMIAELNELGTGDEAARWAKRRYPDKTKRLNAADAEHIDQCFRTKILSFAAHDAEGAGVDIEGASAEPSAQPNGRGAKKPKQAKSIDKSTLSFPEPRRVRIASTSGTSLSNRAWSVAASPAMRITYALRKPAHSDVRSAMSSPSPCAGASS